MKKSYMAGAAIALFIGLQMGGYCEEKKMELKTQEQKLGYVLGLEIGSSLKDIKTEIEINAFLKGIEDNFVGNQLLLNTQDAAKIKDEFLKKKQEEHMKKMTELAVKNKKDEDDFLAKNKSEKGVITTASGLQYIVVQEGTGELPKPENKVTVHYTGKLIDGTEFDSSIKRGQPATFQVNQVIPGWSEALLLMKAGGKYKIFIPSNLAYGERGAAPRIAPNSLLIFEVELIKVEK
jgi:FKBP-type peptidyl-prolyl cis-trans isomerase